MTIGGARPGGDDPGRAGHAWFSQGILLDITDERLAEQQVRDAEERYRAIVEHVPAAIYLDLADRRCHALRQPRRSKPSRGFAAGVDGRSGGMAQDRARGPRPVERGYLRAIE